MRIKNTVHETFDENGEKNGILIPIYNANDEIYPIKAGPRQVYLTTVKVGKIKGPHLHFIRTGYFTCVSGDVRIVVKIDGNYNTYFSGENYDYASITVPTGIPAAVQNIGQKEALVLNMPSPAWTPEMNDEHSADFSDFNFDIW